MAPCIPLLRAMSVLRDICNQERIYDWFCTAAFGIAILASFAAGVASRAIVHGTYAATLFAYATLCIVTLARFARDFRSAMLGATGSRALWAVTFASAVVGGAASTLQLLPSNFCTSGCLVDTLGLPPLPLGIIVIALAPLAETLLFFGAFQTFAISLTGKTAAALLTIGLFTLAHGQLNPYVIAVGALMAIIRSRSIPLLPILSMHVSANAVAFALAIRS